MANDDLHVHIQNLLEALVTEQDWERREHEKQLQLSLVERIELGVSWPLVQLRSVRNIYSGYIVHIEQNSKSTLHDGIAEGDLVVLHTTSTYKNGISGRCIWVDDESAEIRISLSRDKEFPSWLSSGTFVITKSVDEGTYTSYKKGLFFALNNDFSLKKPLLEEWSPLDDVIPYTHPKLNDMQQVAVGEALDDIQNDRDKNRVTVIHGPPGTGKTHTLSILVSICIQRGERPWALADSNAAADNMVRSLQKLNIDVLRLGSEYRIAKDVYDASLFGRMENHPQKEALRILEKEISKMSSGRAKGRLYKERREMIKNMERDILSSGQVVVSTLGTMTRRAKDITSPIRIIIDEATQAIEPAIWSILPYAKRLILMGDPHQLGPVVEHSYLQRSLLQRLIEGTEVPPPMLNIQHRMSQSIMEMVLEVYGKSYQASPHVASQKMEIPSSDSFWSSRRRIFLDTVGFGEPEERDPISHSLFNQTESEIVSQIVQQLQQQGVQAKQISIVAPYRAQVAKLQKMQNMWDSEIEVTTINAFQGREQDVIICSFVRSNLKGELGFVRDERRLTVALTRAKKLFIGIGDSATLAGHPRFARLFELLDEDLHSMWLGFEV
jgi:ATP-dependent RNA/DNA helicase IGHMBP2